MWTWFMVAFAAEPSTSAQVAPPRVAAARSRIDWRIAGDEAVQTLSAYLQVDTTNPPGNEDRGVAFLGEILDREGIPWERIELSPGRSSLVARVKGAGSAPPLCLMHHIDTASYESRNWPTDRGPLSGAIADGHVWGRGAVDMKGMGAIEVLTLAWLVRANVPLARDVVLLAVADEEVDNTGAKQLATPEQWAKIGCSHLINEGGLGVADALFEGQAVHAISVAEKGTLWVELAAAGRPGHGSTAEPDVEAPERMRRAMNALAAYKPDFVLGPELEQLLQNVGEHRGGFAGMVLKSRTLLKWFAWGQLKSIPTTRAAMHDTIHLTGTHGEPLMPNVLPSTVYARYDCRLLPGTTPEEHLARLEHLLRKVEGITLRVVHSGVANGSPVEDPLFTTIARYAVEDRPHAVAGPLLSVGFTDSLILRPLGVVAFGYEPFELTAEVAGTMHGDGERIPVDQVGEGLRRLFSIVVDFAGAG